MFRASSSDEAKERLIRFRKQQREYASMSNSQLADVVKHVFDNCAIPHSRHILRGSLVYDSVMWHVAVPELIKRLKSLE